MLKEHSSYFLITLLLFILSCGDPDVHTLDFKSFKIDVPKTWIKGKKDVPEGSDGEIILPGEKRINYMAGMPSYCLTPDSALHTEIKINIDGFTGNLIKPVKIEKGMYLLSIDSIAENAFFMIETRNLTMQEEEQFIDALKSIRFNRDYFNKTVSNSQ
jgi:hypothetical protein